MDITPHGLLVNWVPQLPSIVQTALLAALSRSPNAEHQTWLIEVFVASMRPIIQTPAPLLRSQNALNFDPGVFGKQWVVPYVIPGPRNKAKQETGNADSRNAVTIQEAMEFAISTLASHESEKSCMIPDFPPQGVEAEWTSYRSAAKPWTRPPLHLSPEQIYAASLADMPEGEDSPAIIYAHGGAFCLMDPANHRFLTSRLAQATSSRVLSVRYRLSPQGVFPAALMDLLLAYLALLHPPPGAFHRPVPANRIVLAGDSSGGNLVTALQILLVTLVQHGKNNIIDPWSSSAPNYDANPSTIIIPVKPTASLSLSSPWLDVTRSLPSQRLNARWDFVAPASMLTPELMSTSPLFPADEIWPAQPARTETYCEAFMCAHPLVSPLMAPKRILQDFPSTYISAGWEGMTDESEVFCRRLWETKDVPFASVVPSAAAAHGRRETAEEGICGPDSGYGSSIEQSPTQPAADAGRRGDTSGPVRTLAPRCPVRISSEGVEIIFDGYTGMPHTFPIVPFNAASRQAQANREKHITRAVTRCSHTPAAPFKPHGSGSVVSPPPRSHSTWTHSKTMQSTSLAFSDLGMQVGPTSMCGYERTEALSDEVVNRLVNEGREFRVSLEARLRMEAKESDQGAMRASQVPPVVGNEGSRLATLGWAVVFPIRDMVFLFFNWVLWQMMQVAW